MGNKVRESDHIDQDDYLEHRGKLSEPTKGPIERILTPGATANNVIKTAATGIISGTTFILMSIYALAGDRLAGASYLPIATIATSAIAIACVWVFGRLKTEEAYSAEFSKLKKELRKLNTNIEELQSQNSELEQRLSNVELLESFEDKLAKLTLENQAQTQKTLNKNPTAPPISSNLSSHSDDSSQDYSTPQREME